MRLWKRARGSDPESLVATDRFCFIGSTGRTGSKFFHRFLSDFGPSAAVFHKGFRKRVSNSEGEVGTALAVYLARLAADAPGKTVSFECNPALLEQYGLSYGLESARQVLDALLGLGRPVRGLFISRHPVGYLNSIRSAEWQWDWTSLPFFEQVHGMSRSRWEALSPFEKICTAWAMKNRYFRTLRDAEHCLALRFEDLFGSRVRDEDFVGRVEEVASFLGIELTARRHEIVDRRAMRVGARSAGLEPRLTPREAAVLEEICSEEMDALGYSLDHAPGAIL